MMGTEPFLIPPTIAVPVGYTLGNDLVYLPAFMSAFNPLFQKRVFTVAEIAYCDGFNDPVLRYASTFAAKEAVYKATQQLDSKLKLGWKRIEIQRDRPAGMPTVILHTALRQPCIQLTISHDGDYVWAMALASITAT